MQFSKRAGNLCRSRALPQARVAKRRMLAEKPDQARMSRIVLVSNRVTDMRKAPQAGGVAVALADIVRTRPALWFGWNGEIAPEHATRKPRARGPHRHCPALRGRSPGLLPGLRQLGACGRSFTIGSIWRNSRRAFLNATSASTAAWPDLLQPLLRPDDVIWVHDYHLLPFATELRSSACRTPSAFTCTFRFRPGRPSWPSPSISSWRARSPPMT